MNLLAPRSYPSWQMPFRRFYRMLFRLQRRLIPRLVWYGQEVDVRVTFKEAKLRPVGFDPETGEGMAELKDQLNNGCLADIERQLREIGIGFDKGAGLGGRDWEWDWSLTGPINIKFIRTAKKPELRQ